MTPSRTTKGVSSAIGAAFGVVLGPAFAWTLLRRVPLWRAIGETALAAAIGAGVAFVYPIVVTPFVAALSASTGAAFRLRYSFAKAAPALLEGR